MSRELLPQPPVGTKFNRLTVTGACVKRQGKTGYHCPVLCDCGSTRLVKLSQLLSGGTNSCGCGRTDRFTKFATKHGFRFEPVYLVWLEMRQRCKNPKNKQWPNYGGRGIEVCEAWNDYAIFNSDMGPRPSDKFTLERRNNNKGYSGDNCFWASRSEQVRNRRNALVVMYQGCEVSFSDLLSMVGRESEYSKLHARLSSGWSIDDLLETP